MSTEVTTEMMNRIICEFMGWEFKPDGEDWFKAYHDGELMWADNGYGLEQIFLKGFKYHEDWNKLMPVVEKIEQSGCIVEIWLSLGKGCRIQRPTATPPSIAIVEESNSTIDAVYKACYQAIVYLNQQKQTNDERGTNKG